MTDQPNDQARTSTQHTTNQTTAGNSMPELSAIETAYSKVLAISEHILRANQKTNDQATMGGGLVFEQACKEMPEIRNLISRNTFLQYLSNAVKDPESSINCLGRRQGYYLYEQSREVEKIMTTSSDKTVDGGQQRKQREAFLYPILETWLIAQGYQSSNISSSRSLGKWGNPDVAGINAIDGFSGISIEVVTIEAKVSLENWEQWIFEAVSHRRFANRSYFAFAHPAEAISKIPQDMRYYAELYNIGVLALSVEDSIFDKLSKGDISAPLGVDQVDVIEVFSAPYNFVQPKYQIKFCNALGINTEKGLYTWGLSIK